MSFERELDRRMKALPERRAPRGLSARVLAAVELRSRPWHARPFWTWTPAAQGAFVAALTLGASALAGTATVAGGEASAALGARVDWVLTLLAALGAAAWSVKAFVAAACAAALALCAVPVAAFAALPRARFH